MLLRVGEVPTFVVFSPEAAAEVMKTNDPVFASRPQGAMADVVGFGGKGLIFAPYGEHWRQMRKVCVVELLSARQVRGAHPAGRGVAPRRVRRRGVGLAGGGQPQPGTDGARQQRHREGGVRRRVPAAGGVPPGARGGGDAGGRVRLGGPVPVVTAGALAERRRA